MADYIVASETTLPVDIFTPEALGAILENYPGRVPTGREVAIEIQDAFWDLHGTLVPLAMQRGSSRQASSVHGTMISFHGWLRGVLADSQELIMSSQARCR